MTPFQEIINMFFIFLLVLTILIYIYQCNSKETFIDFDEQIKSHCNRINEENTEVPTLMSIGQNSEKSKYPLRDFNIKTAYNCCALDTFEGSFVDTCALKMCLQQGVRCLDFEIYSRNNKPVIATSSKYDMTSLNTLNHVDFSDALKVINNYAFEQSIVPNSNDPLIIHMRIMTENSQMYEKLAEYISKDINVERMLGVEYSYANYKKNFGDVKINNLLGKVIFIVNNNLTIYESTRLYEYINASSQSEYIRFMYDKDLTNIDSQNIKSYNKTKMTIVLPDITNKSNNIDSSKGQSLGCQMIGMSFQNKDENLNIYTSYFDNNKSAFVLKEDNLRIVLNGVEGVDEQYLKTEVD